MTDTKSDHDEAAWAAERPDIAHENSYGRFDDFSPPRSDEAPVVSKMEIAAGVSDKTRELVKLVYDAETDRASGKISTTAKVARHAALLSHIESIEREARQRAAGEEEKAFAAQSITVDKIASLRTQLSTALRDSARLDWLGAQRNCVVTLDIGNRCVDHYLHGTDRTIRAAIDAAMKGST